jgi:hypothetical protein
MLYPTKIEIPIISPFTVGFENRARETPPDQQTVIKIVQAFKVRRLNNE